MPSTLQTRGKSETSELVPFAAAITANPTDGGNWLIMADWLEDGGFEAEAVLVRSLFGEAAPVEGSISRGYYQWENGGSHWVGVSIGYEQGEWRRYYWSNGNFHEAITREQAVEEITRVGKPWKVERRQQWTGEVVRSEGVTPYHELTIRATH